MSSSTGFLAYLMRRPEPQQVIDIRSRHAEEHLARVHRGPLRRTAIGDGGSGFLAWELEDDPVDWDYHTIRHGTGVAWLHVPSAAAGPESGADPHALAQDVFAGRRVPSELGAPFAVARWSDGVLDIVNDMLGLVRLFHFKFADGDIWTTRAGLAHVFMGAEPVKNPLAWGGMATLSWAPMGVTQMGAGRQLRGGSKIRAGFPGGRRHLSETDGFGAWLDEQRHRPRPPIDRTIEDMEDVMSTARRWPRRPIADLSGGKDSRVVAAVGIRSGAVDAVQTIVTDHGEVETARRLMQHVETDVEHLVVPRRDPSSPEEDALERVTTQHAAWEGRYLAVTAYNAPAFRGFEAVDRAKFNGLGGEAMAGGTLGGSWRERLVGAPADLAGQRLVAEAHLGKEVTAETKAMVAESVRQYVDFSADMGIHTADGVMDVFYLLDKMPNWSNTFTVPSTICPLFAASLLTSAAQTIGAPVPYGELHRRLLRAAIPGWADVPFYKPTPQKRAVPFIWDNGDWAQIRGYVLSNLDRPSSYDADAVVGTVQHIDGGGGTKRDEVFVQRLVWELTFDAHVAEVARQARSTAAAVNNHQRATEDVT